jgi:uncharacterized surface protein with fasciclin (FAS1) repeats
MYKLLKNLFVLFCVVAFFASCRKEAFKEEYDRPENLQPPIYQVLETAGNFKTLLAVIDKSGYKNTLSAAGYWTLFAPNDAAFQKYFTDNNTSLSAMSAATARNIVTYSLVFNAFQSNRLPDYQSSRGWVVNNAFKRRTAYYDDFYTAVKPAALASEQGDSVVVLSANRNAVAPPFVSYVYGDNNNKYVPYFLTSYMSARNLGASDYNYFFPNSAYTGSNVANATIVKKDILAENGVIHEIDQVILPLPNIEQQLAASNQYSEFKRLFDDLMVTYLQNNDAAARYNTITRKSNKVFIKQYSGLLAFALGNENYNKLEDNDGQTDGYTLFAPNNTALNKYLNEVILEFYKPNPNVTLSNAEAAALMARIPRNIVADFLNAHLFINNIWPSKFASSSNFLGEIAKFNSGTNVVDKKFCSNGIFYGTNVVQPANVFSTVYSRGYLDPEYSIMNTAINISLKNVLTNPGAKFNIFMLSNTTLRALGYDYNGATAQFSYTLNGTAATATVARDQLLRLINLHIIPIPDNDLPSYNGQGVVESNQGEYVRFNNNVAFAGGNLETTPPVNAVIDPSKTRTYTNGKVFFLSSGTLLYPTGTIAGQIGKIPAYNDFYQYLINSTQYNLGTLEIVGLQIGANYTFFIPTQAAIQQAVKDGILPGNLTTGQPTYNPSSNDDKAKVARFIQSHILNGISIAPDGKKSPNGSALPTLLKNSIGDDVNLNIYNSPGAIRIVDSKGRQGNIIPANSSNLGTRALFHQVDNYFQYTF